MRTLVSKSCDLLMAVITFVVAGVWRKPNFRNHSGKSQVNNLRREDAI